MRGKAKAMSTMMRLLMMMRADDTQPHSSSVTSAARPAGLSLFWSVSRPELPDCWRTAMLHGLSVAGAHLSWGWLYCTGPHAALSCKLAPYT